MYASTDDYFHDLLERYKSNFDITPNFTLGKTTYPAYAQFFSLGEKYVLKKEAKLWAIRAYEHVLFIETKAVTSETLCEIQRTIKEDMEPSLVRKGDKYPEADHMCSYLTFILISQKTLEKEIQKAIKRFSYDKGYMFGFRGHSQGRIACACLDSETVITNYAGKELKKLLTNIFNTLKGREEKAS